MGRHPLSDADRKFRSEVAEKFTAAMKQHGLETQSAAARELGVTRAAFSQYLLLKSTPQAEILARAMTKWGIKLRYRDKEFAVGAFGRTEAVAPPRRQDSIGLQMELFDEPQRFENDHLVVTLQRSEKATLQVTIRMKKASGPVNGRTGRVSRAAS